MFSDFICSTNYGKIFHSYNIFKYWFNKWRFSSVFFLADEIHSSNVLRRFGILKEGKSIIPKTSKNWIKFEKEIKIKELDNKNEREVKYEERLIKVLILQNK